MSNIKTTVQSLWRNTSETAEQQLHAAPLAKTLTAANFWARSPLARARGRRIYLFIFGGYLNELNVERWMPLKSGGQSIHYPPHPYPLHPPSKNLTLKPQLPKPQPSHPKLQPLKLGKVILIDFRLSYPPKRLSHPFSRKPLGTT